MDAVIPIGCQFVGHAIALILVFSTGRAVGKKPYAEQVAHDLPADFPAQTEEPVEPEKVMDRSDQGDLAAHVDAGAQGIPEGRPFGVQVDHIVGFAPQQFSELAEKPGRFGKRQMDHLEPGLLEWLRKAARDDPG